MSADALSIRFETRRALPDERFTEALVFTAEGHVQIPLRNKSTQVRRYVSRE
jgi:hypothetical protein